MKRITSIKEIANLAGCSIATVSNVINNKGRVSEALKEKILEICKTHGYLPNSAGRNLRRQKNETIGLMFYPSCAALFRNSFYAVIVESLQAKLESQGYDLLLSSYDSSHSTHETPRFMRQGKVDGIIMLGRFPREEVLNIKKFGMPLLHLDAHREKIKVDYVSTDGFAATSKIVDHLVSLGHRRIIFMAYSYEDSNTEQRESGFNYAIKQHHLSPDESFTVTDFSNDEDGYAKLSEILQSDSSPTAVVAVNDTMAAHFQEFLQNDGYSVPDDISLFGFNGDEISAKAKPSISTVGIDKAILGIKGADYIINRINDQKIPHQSYSLPGELLHRGSVSAPRQKNSLKDIAIR